MKSSGGSPTPLGAAWDGRGTNFAIFSAKAKSVELLLFDGEGKGPAERVPLTERDGFVWHAFLQGVGPGTLYSYSIDGEYDPALGYRFNRNKSLLDPYARAIAGSVQWNDALFGYTVGNPSSDLSFDERDSAPYAPKGVVVDPSFDWEGDRPPGIQWKDTIIYEAHVKGFTKLKPDIEERLRGTYAGLGSQNSISYFKDLGITSVELLPVHHHVQNRFLSERGLVNYWGYNTIGYFAPDSRYSSSGARGEQVTEFKSMVRALHSTGIEVILDVVYNHTAEGNQLGPTLALRGIDNLAYYRLDRRDMRLSFDVSGTGNSLNLRNPFVIRLLMDSLRYWVTEMHVDGFRFDLASALARELYDVDFLSTFFKAVHQDPTLSRVKLIAEPWDLGHGGYQVGNFPPPWAEWNDRYRNVVRRFWKGESILPQLATRLAGSSDLYARQNRGPTASINFVTCHDGFTLNDLVSYNEKHNEANGEENRDGISNNHSWNCGHEGPSDDPKIAELRQRQCKNFIATLFLSQGVPMITAGDEVRRTQAGNNNAYCQDNETSWLDWTLGEAKRDLLAFTKKAIAIRRAHPVFRRTNFFREGNPGDSADLIWLKRDGSEIRGDGWQHLEDGVLGMLLTGSETDELHKSGERVTDDAFILALNGSAAEAEFVLPGGGEAWRSVLDTSGETKADDALLKPGGSIHLPAKSMVLLRKPR